MALGSPTGRKLLEPRVERDPRNLGLGAALGAPYSPSASQDEEVDGDYFYRSGLEEGDGDYFYRSGLESPYGKPVERVA